MPKNAAADVLSVGEVLARLREEKGMSLEDVHRATMIPIAKLALLEANDFAAFDNQIFVSGYIRSYAKLVGGNGDILVENFNNGGMVKVSEPPPSYTPKPVLAEQKHSSSVVAAAADSGSNNSGSNTSNGSDTSTAFVKAEASSTASVSDASDAALSNAGSAGTGLGPNDFPVKTAKRFSLLELIANLRLSVVAIILVIIWVLASLLMGDEPLSTPPAEQPAPATVAEQEHIADAALVTASADDQAFLDGEIELEETQAAIAPAAESTVDAGVTSINQEPQTLSLPASAVNDVNVSEQAPATGDTHDNTSVGTDAPAGDSSADTQVNEIAVAEAVDLTVGNGSQQLVFSFMEDCWIEVIDTKTQSKFADLKNKGDNLRLFGEGPFEIMLGNAHVVTLSVNGESYPITPRGTRKTLRFTVDVAE